MPDTPGGGGNVTYTETREFIYKVALQDLASSVARTLRESMFDLKGDMKIVGSAVQRAVELMKTSVRNAPIKEMSNRLMGALADPKVTSLLSNNMMRSLNKVTKGMMDSLGDEANLKKMEKSFLRISGSFLRKIDEGMRALLFKYPTAVQTTVEMTKEFGNAVRKLRLATAVKPGFLLESIQKGLSAGPLIPPMEVRALTTVNQELRKFSGGITDAVKKLQSMQPGGVAKIAGKATGGESLYSISQAVGGWFKKSGAKGAVTGAGVESGVTGFLSGALKGVAGQFMALIAIGAAIQKILEPFMGAIQSMINMLITPLQAAIMPLVTMVLEIGSSLIPMFISIGEALRPVMEASAKYIKAWLVPLLKALMPILTTAFKIIGGVAEKLISAATPIMEALGSVVGALLEPIGEILNAILPVLDILIVVAKLITAMVVPIIKLLGALLTPVLKVLSFAIQLLMIPINLLIAFLDGIMSLFEPMMSMLDILLMPLTMLGDILKEFQPIIDEMKSVYAEIGDLFKEGMSFLADIMKAGMKPLLTFLVSLMKTVMSFIKGAIDTIKSLNPMNLIKEQVAHLKGIFGNTRPKEKKTEITGVVPTREVILRDFDRLMGPIAASSSEKGMKVVTMSMAESMKAEGPATALLPSKAPLKADDISDPIVKSVDDLPDRFAQAMSKIMPRQFNLEEDVEEGMAMGSYL